ncbi:MAG: hypothetical protein KGI55_03535 [Gammaproteobacteria bacterium]|nr:hypothetical protein [Gammaproteobacteria bacterium]
MNTPTPSVSLPWYRYPFMWLVVGLPVSVVIACIVTYVLILEHPDPVVPHSPVSSSSPVHHATNSIQPPER